MMAMRGVMGVLGVLGVLGAATGAGPQALAAQAAERTECRCVDQDGNVIENCACFRAPEFEAVTLDMPFGLFGRRAQIGVYIDGAQDDAEVGGVRITEVREDSPAWEAGMRTGDVVLSVAGRSVDAPLSPEDEEDLREELKEDGSTAVARFIRLVGELEPQEEAEIVVSREGVRRTLTVVPEAAAARFSFRGPEGVGAWTIEEMDELREMSRELEGLRFRMDEEELEVIREEAERARELAEEARGFSVRMSDEEMLRLQEMTERIRFEARELRDQERELIEELRAERGGAPRVSAFFRREGTDPCHEIRQGGASALMVIGGSCVDGVQLTEMNPGLAIYFGTDEGVLVTEVADGSSLGLEAGDVVLGVGDRKVDTPAEVRRILDRYETDEAVTFRVRRQDREIRVSGTRRGN